MIYDVFFISFDESNAEQNWQRVLDFHSTAKRIDKAGSISESHLACNNQSSTEWFWTVDGDNWLYKPLPIHHELTADLAIFEAIDPIDRTAGTSGAVKLWKKDRIINPNMSRGDFCKYAVQDMQVVRSIISEHAYNSTPYETWRKSFRHMVKCFAGIVASQSLQLNLDIMERHRSLNQWSYKGYLDAKTYVDECDGDFNLINRINDYEWLREKFYR